jgi:hypothetical protein
MLVDPSACSHACPGLVLGAVGALHVLLLSTPPGVFTSAQELGIRCPVTFGAKVSWDLCSMTARLSVVDRPGFWGGCLQFSGGPDRNLVDPASSHMLVSKIKPCMSQYKLLYGETANGSLKQL